MNSSSIDNHVLGIEKYLRKIDYIIRLEGRKIINDLSITVPQFGALQILIQNSDLTVGELSKKMSLACSTITDLIDRMEKNKLVVRKKDPKDKRVVIIEVLPKGHDILEKVLDGRREFIKSKIINLELDEIEILNKSLLSLYDNISNETN